MFAVVVVNKQKIVSFKTAVCFGFDWSNIIFSQLNSRDSIEQRVTVLFLARFFAFSNDCGILKFESFRDFLKFLWKNLAKFLTSTRKLCEKSLNIYRIIGLCCFLRGKYFCGRWTAEESWNQLFLESGRDLFQCGCIESLFKYSWYI